MTATLRNLADISNHRSDFLSGAVIENLSPLLDLFGDDADVMLNISRILRSASDPLLNFVTF